MSEKRMFAKSIIDSDAFLDMPVTARLLYYDLGMRADDDGFVNSPKKIMRVIGASDDDLKLLCAKKFIIPFDSGVVVIKHWRIHNYIRKDTYKETNYKDEKRMLELDENNAYRLPINTENTALLQSRHEPVTNPSRTRDEPVTQYSIDKNRLNKSSIDIEFDKSNSLSDSSDAKKVISMWNELDGLGNIKGVKRIDKDSKRYKNLKARLKTYSLEDFRQAIENIKQSKFLRGENKSGWTVTFDWFVLPSNFPKVLEGNYNHDREQNSKGFELLI